MQRIPGLVERCGDHQLKGVYMTTLLESYEYQAVPDPSGLAAKASEQFELAKDPIGEGM